MMKKRFLWMAFVALAIGSQAQTGTLRREPVTTSAFTRRALTNETAAQFRAWIGTSTNGTDVTYDLAGSTNLPYTGLSLTARQSITNAAIGAGSGTAKLDTTNGTAIYNNPNFVTNIASADRSVSMIIDEQTSPGFWIYGGDLGLGLGGAINLAAQTINSWDDVTNYFTQMGGSGGTATNIYLAAPVPGLLTTNAPGAWTLTGNAVNTTNDFGRGARNVKGKDQFYLWTTVQSNKPVRFLLVGDSLADFNEVTRGVRRTFNQYMTNAGWGSFWTEHPDGGSETTLPFYMTGNPQPGSSSYSPGYYYPMTNGAVFTTVGSIYGNQAQIYFHGGPTLGSILVQTQLNGGSFGTLATLVPSGMAAGYRATNFALPLGNYNLKFTSTGSNNFATVGINDTTAQASSAWAKLAPGGVTLESIVTNAGFRVFLTNWNPQCIIFDVKDPVADLYRASAWISANLATNYDLIWVANGPNLPDAGAEDSHNAIINIGQTNNLFNIFDQYSYLTPTNNSFSALPWASGNIWQDGAHLGSKGIAYISSAFADWFGVGPDRFAMAGISVGTGVLPSNVITQNWSGANLTTQTGMVANAANPSALAYLGGMPGYSSNIAILNLAYTNLNDLGSYSLGTDGSQKTTLNGKRGLNLLINNSTVVARADAQKMKFGLPMELENTMPYTVTNTAGGAIVSSNRTLYYVTDLATNAVNLGSGGGGSGSVPSGWRSQYFVDSVNGSDSNSGTNALAAWKTIAKLTSTVTTDNIEINLARGSRFREQLVIGSNNVVQAYGGSGTRPILDASEIQATWSLAGAYTNVYAVSNYVVTDGGNNARITVIEDGKILTWATSAANCETNEGSYYSPIDPVSGSTNVVFVHPYGNGNPNSNGKVYELSKRLYGIFAGKNNSFYNLITRNQTGPNGSFEAGTDTYASGLTMENGTKHNWLVASGTLEDCDFRGQSFNSSASLGVFYALTDGLSATLRRCKGGGWPNRLADAEMIYGHTGGPEGAYANFLAEDCEASYNDSFGSVGIATNGLAIFNRCATYGATMGNFVAYGGTNLFLNCTVRTDPSTTASPSSVAFGSAGRSNYVLVSGCEVYGVDYAITSSDSYSTIEVRDSFLYGNITTYIGSNCTYIVSNTIIASPFPFTLGSLGNTIRANSNCYPNFNSVLFNNVSYTTWAAWQAIPTDTYSLTNALLYTDDIANGVLGYSKFSPAVTNHAGPGWGMSYRPPLKLDFVSTEIPTRRVTDVWSRDVFDSYTNTAFSTLFPLKTNGTSTGLTLIAPVLSGGFTNLNATTFKIDGLNSFEVNLNKGHINYDGYLQFQIADVTYGYMGPQGVSGKFLLSANHANGMEIQSVNNTMTMKGGGGGVSAFLFYANESPVFEINAANKPHFYYGLTSTNGFSANATAFLIPPSTNGSAGMALLSSGNSNTYWGTVNATSVSGPYTNLFGFYDGNGKLIGTNALPLASATIGDLTATNLYVAVTNNYVYADANGRLVGSNAPTAGTGTGTVSNSAALTASAIVLGGGGGAVATTSTASGIVTFLGTPTSANLFAAITDETGGAGVLVGSVSPTITGLIVNGIQSLTNSWSINGTISLDNNFTLTSGAATGGITGVAGTITGTERFAQLTIKSTGDLTFTNPPSFYCSDGLKSRTFTNGNLTTVIIHVIPGFSTNLTYSWSRSQ